MFDRKNEQAGKRAFLALWETNGGWYETIEHARGGTLGTPDVRVLVGKMKPYSVPLEIKLADRILDENHTAYHQTGRPYYSLKLHKVRPAQIAWHRKYFKAGGASAIIACVIENGEWSFYAVPASDLRDWKKPVEIGSDMIPTTAYLLWPSRSRTINVKLERFMRVRYNICTSYGNHSNLPVIEWQEGRSAYLREKRERIKQQKREERERKKINDEIERDRLKIERKKERQHERRLRSRIHQKRARVQH